MFKLSKTHSSILDLGLGLAIAASSGCGGSSPTYTVANHALKVADSGYVTTDQYYCSAAAPGQLKLTIVDYNPICGAAVPATSDGGARNPQLEHNELELLFVTSAHDDPKVPYEVSPPDCTIGPAGPGIATFKHYASNAKTPEITMAQSGNLFLTYRDPTDKKPATGSFDLDFGAGGKISGTFETFTCN